MSGEFLEGGILMDFKRPADCVDGDLRDHEKHFLAQFSSKLDIASLIRLTQQDPRQAQAEIQASLNRVNQLKRISEVLVQANSQRL